MFTQSDRVAKSGNVKVFDDMLTPRVMCEMSSKLTGTGKKTKRLEGASKTWLRGANPHRVLQVLSLGKCTFDRQLLSGWR